MQPPPLPSNNESIRSWFEPVVNSVKRTTVDIIALPSIGANPRTTWGVGRPDSWLEYRLLKTIPTARIRLYNYGTLHESDTIEKLGRRLFELLTATEIRKNPYFFLCHSTGGLVAKACLAFASRTEPNQLLSNCHGIAFFATPHQGSSYLSADEYMLSIRGLFHLEHNIPALLREELRPRQQYLWHLSNRFKWLSSDMKVWSYLETIDSTFQIVNPETSRNIEFHAPLTSIRSGLLDIEHEREIPMATDHMGTARFQGLKLTLEHFLEQLKDAVDIAVDLSRRNHTELNVETVVKVQINGFFEDPALGVSDESPLKMWSVNVSLREYLLHGPAACLRDRLKRDYSGEVDDSSISSFDTPRPAQHPIPRTERPEIEDEQIAHQSNHIGHHHPHHNNQEGDEEPLHPPIQHSQAFIDPNYQSPTIHITEAVGDFSRVSSESPPPPASRRRRSSAYNPTNIELVSNLGNSPERASRRPSSPAVSDAPSSPRDSNHLRIPVSARDRSYQNGSASETPRAVPGLGRPEPDTEKLLWIHVPYNHTGWVSQVIRKACQDRNDSNFLRRYINDENWYLNLNRARHLEPHARFVKPRCIHSRQNGIPLPKLGSAEDPQLALYVPYLHWDTYRNLIHRRKVVEDRLHQGRSHPVPNRIYNSSLEAKLIWQYLGSEPPIHFRRTLDQYGYPNLRSTVARDDDQMLWKRTRKPAHIDPQLKEYLNVKGDDPDYSDQPAFLDGNVLMVDQLWLWIIDQKTIVTFFPKQEATTSEGVLFEQSNLHSSIYNELNGDLSRRFENAGDLAALIMLHAVTVLLDKTLHHDLQVLRIFEESISILTESLTKSFKRFRNRGFSNRPVNQNRTPNGKVMNSEQRDYRDRQTARRNRDDLSVLLELRDIEDELSTILKLLDQQNTVVEQMMKYFEGTGCGKVFLDAAQQSINKYRTQIGEMKDNSHTSQKAVETILDLKQKQANVDEAKLARWQAEVTQNQSRAVMVFTIFTVIFLPLSFFTSLFGMNARDWSGTAQNPSLRTIFSIGAPASCAIIFFALVMAFSESLREAVTKSNKIGLGFLKDFILNPIGKLLYWDSFKNKLPSLHITEDPAIRQKLDYWLGYLEHETKFETDDFWQRRQGKVSSQSDWRNQGRNTPRAGSGEYERKARSVTGRSLPV